MHGEYKPPGGKLVAADVEVASGRMARVQISGDFFPEPDDSPGVRPALPAYQDRARHAG